MTCYNKFIWESEGLWRWHMKMIHCADLHIDSKMETNLTTEQAKSRRLELLDTFEKMVEEGIANNVAVIMIAGDMFDTAQNSQKRLKTRVLDVIKTHPSIDFLYLQGNHDHDNYFKELGEKPDNLKLFSEKWTTYTYGNIAISGIELDKENAMGRYEELMLNEHQTNIVMLHGQVVLSGKSSRVEDISINELQNKYIDYLALGHIHSHSVGKLDQRGIYCYSGCLEGRGYDECGEKGFVLLDVPEEGASEEKLCYEFLPLAKRIIHEVEVDVSVLEDHQEILEMAKSTVSHIPEKDYVKIVLRGQVEEDVEIDIEHLLQKFEGRFYTYKIDNKTEVKIDYLKYENDISLKGEFIRTVQGMEITEQEKSRVIMMGIQALKGEVVAL